MLQHVCVHKREESNCEATHKNLLTIESLMFITIHVYYVNVTNRDSVVGEDMKKSR